MKSIQAQIDNLDRDSHQIGKKSNTALLILAGGGVALIYYIFNTVYDSAQALLTLAIAAIIIGGGWALDLRQKRTTTLKRRFEFEDRLRAMKAPRPE